MAACRWPGWVDIVLVCACCFGAGTAVRAEDVIGTAAAERVRSGDTLLEIARRHDLGFAEIRAANPGLDPWLPQEDALVILPLEHVLPDAPRRGIVINLAELRLYHYAQGDVESFPLGIGRTGWQTRTGRTSVVRKASRPVWVPTASERADEPELPARVPPGPDNPMGDFALYLAWPGYAIHGTNRPYSIGRRDSHGCVRLYPDDIARLYRSVPIHTQVTVVDQPVKLGWRSGQLYLEVHSGQAGADLLEQGVTPPPPPLQLLLAAVSAAAGGQAHRVVWDTVVLTGQQMRGVPVQVTRGD